MKYLFSLMFLLFLYLKLTGEILWSWWWISAPLWGPIAGTTFLLGLIATLAIVFGAEMKISSKQKKPSALYGR